MPLKPQTQQDKPKDNKQLLLDLIAQQYGHSNAVVMDKALKTQDKQIEEAMSQGMSADDIAKSRNIDMNQVNKMLQSQIGGIQMEQLNVQKPQGIMQNVFGQSGVTTNEQEKPIGVKQGGFFDFNVGPTNTLIAQLLGLSQVKMNPMKMQSEQEYRNLEIQLKKKQLEQLNQTGELAKPDDMFAQFNIPPEEQEDYIMKPTKQTIRGMVTTVPILERKKTLPAKQLEDLSGLENNMQDFSKNMQSLIDKGLEIGPGFSTRPGAIADILAQMKGAEFSTLKASIGRSFQKYRKWVTGVQAGYPELNMLAPNVPKATDANDVFISKTIDIIKDIARNRELMVDYFSKGGYAVSKLRNRDINITEQAQPQSRKQYVKTGTNKKGQRVGMLPDGTIEVLSEE